MLMCGRPSQREQIDHVFTFDANAWRIWDPAEKFGLRSEPSVFEACVGDGIEFCGIFELKRIDRQNVRKSKAYLHKSTDKRRELWKRKGVLEEKNNKYENKV